MTEKNQILPKKLIIKTKKQLRKEQIARKARKIKLEKAKKLKAAKAKKARLLKIAKKAELEKQNKNIDKDKWWRPTKIDYSVVQILIDIFRVAWSINDATAQAEISKGTYHNRIKYWATFLDINGKEKDFKTEMRRARNFPRVACKSIILNEAFKWSAKASLEYLKRIDPEWKDKAELSGDNENPVEKTIFILPDNWRWPQSNPKNDSKQTS